MTPEQIAAIMHELDIDSSDEEQENVDVAPYLQQVKQNKEKLPQICISVRIHTCRTWFNLVYMVNSNAFLL